MHHLQHWQSFASLSFHLFPLGTLCVFPINFLCVSFLCSFPGWITRITSPTAAEFMCFSLDGLTAFQQDVAPPHVSYLKAQVLPPPVDCWANTDLTSQGTPGHLAPGAVWQQLNRISIWKPDNVLAGRCRGEVAAPQLEEKPATAGVRGAETSWREEANRRGDIRETWQPSALWTAPDAATAQHRGLKSKGSRGLIKSRFMNRVQRRSVGSICDQCF